MKWALLTISVILLSNRVGFSPQCAVERVLKNRQLLFGTTGKQGMNAAEQVPAKQKPLSKSSGDPRAGALCLVRVWVLSSRNTVRHLLVALLSSHGLPWPLVAALVADDLLRNYKLAVRELSRSSQPEISI